LQVSTVVATPDDQNHDGTLDFYTWLAGPNVEDPWVRFLSETEVMSGGSYILPGCNGPNCQPDPFYDGFVFGTGSDDHSNIFKNVTRSLLPPFDYTLWKSITQFADPNTYYYASNGPGTGTYKLNGSGPSVDFLTATNGRQGIFFFDT